MGVPISIDNLCEWGGHLQPTVEGKTKPPAKSNLEKIPVLQLTDFLYDIKR